MRTLFLLLLQLAAASAASITIKEGIPGQVCFVQPLPFASKSFSYTVTVDPSSIELQEGCDASQILLSPLYVSSSCLNPNDNNRSGCPNSNGIVITGTTSSAGTKVPINSSTPLCNQVFSEGPSSNSIVPLSQATTYTRGTVTCGPSSTGYLYFQNNCPASPGTNQSIFIIKIDYTLNYPSCGNNPSSVNSYYRTGTWTSWPIALGIGIAVFFVVFILLTICGRRKRNQQIQMQQQQQMGNVQMMPPPPTGGGGIVMGAPYTGGYPAGYPPPPPQQGAPPMNFVPPPSGVSSTYPSQPTNTIPQPNVGGGSQYPTPEGVGQPAIWYAGGKPPS